MKDRETIDLLNRMAVEGLKRRLDEQILNANVQPNNLVRDNNYRNYVRKLLKKNKKAP